MNPMLADDTASLQRYLPGEPFNYRDVSSERARQRALERWPLLAEVAFAGRTATRVEEASDTAAEQQPTAE